MALFILTGIAERLCASLAAGHRVPPPDTDTAAVLAPINAVFAAFEAGDAAAMLRQVYPDGRVTATGNAGERQRPSPAVLDAIRRAPEARVKGFQERISDPAIEIDGDIAMVWAPFVVRVGGKVSNCGYDHFDLVRDNGTWKIMNLTFSSRTTGCPAQ